MPPPLKSDEVKEDQEETNDDDDNSSVFLSLNPITNSSGSAFIQLGDGRTTTKIFVSVFSPKTTSRAQDERVSKLRGTLDVSVTLASFAFKSLESSSQYKDVEMDLTEKLTKCLRGVVVLESFPKAVVEVRCVVADANGGRVKRGGFSDQFSVDAREGGSEGYFVRVHGSYRRGRGGSVS